MAATVARMGTAAACRCPADLAVDVNVIRMAPCIFPYDLSDYVYRMYRVASEWFYRLRLGMSRQLVQPYISRFDNHYEHFVSISNTANTRETLVAIIKATDD